MTDANATADVAVYRNVTWSPEVAVDGDTDTDVNTGPTASAFAAPAVATTPDAVNTPTTTAATRRRTRIPFTTAP